MKADDPPRLIDLTREPPLRLGQIDVRPATREVVAGSTARVLEPRIMQVLVALTRRRGEVVSRDDLIAECWGGRAVGDDAINRCIQAIRKLAEQGGDFSVTTIARVGYRLEEAAASTSNATTTPRLAVLAFDNLSGDPEMAYFSDGVSEEILQTVARGAALKVIGRGSSFQFRGADKAASRVAAALKVTHILDGSVRRGGSTVRIAAHLIECATETTLWSGRFDRDHSDVLALQDEIAAAVAAALKIAFAPVAGAEAIDPLAYDLYLSTRSPSPGSTAETRAGRIRTLERVISLAPGFARAWLHLASLRVSQLRFDGAEGPYAIARAKAVDAVDTALRLDPRLGEAHQTLGRMEPFAAYQARAALEAKALAAAPNDLSVLYWAFEFSCEVGRFRDAMGYTQRAFELDPLDPRAADSQAYMLENMGRYQESRAISTELLARWPGSSFILYDALAHAAHNADWAWFDGLARIARDRNMYSQDVRGLVWFARNLQNPDRDSIRNAWNRALASFAQTGVMAFDTLTSFYRLGYAQAVFDVIDKATFAFMLDSTARWPSEQTTQLLFNVSHNGEMMRDPRFPRLCAKLGLCDYWVATDRWPDCADAGVLPYDFKAEVRRLAA